MRINLPIWLAILIIYPAISFAQNELPGVSWINFSRSTKELYINGFINGQEDACMRYIDALAKEENQSIDTNDPNIMDKFIRPSSGLKPPAFSRAA